MHAARSSWTFTACAASTSGAAPCMASFQCINAAWLLDVASCGRHMRRHYVWYEFTFLVGMLFLAWAALSLLRHTKR